MSSYKLLSRLIGTVPCLVLQKDNGSEFEILNGYGGALNAWRVPLNSKENTSFINLLDGYSPKDDIYKIGPDVNSGCRLSPFPGRTAYAKFEWEGVEYKLTNNVSWAPHALHGFLQDKIWEFKCFESSNEKCTLEIFCDWPGVFVGFPFPYRATTKISFTGDSFFVESSVKNVGKNPMPYSEGWHPYFCLDKSINNLKLTLPKSKLALLDTADIPTGKFKEDSRFVNGCSIGDEFINDCFCLDNLEMAKQKGSTSSIHTLLESENAVLDIEQIAGSCGYNAIQIYAPPHRKSIAIEPMTSEPDALNHHRGLIIVEPDETIKFYFGAKFSLK